MLGLWALGLTYCKLSRPDRAVETYEQLVIITRRAAAFVGMLGFAYALAKERDKALGLRDELMERSKREYVAPFSLLAIDIGLGDRDNVYLDLEAFAQVESGGWALEAILGPFLDQFESEERFAKLFERLRLAPRLK